MKAVEFTTGDMKVESVAKRTLEEIGKDYAVVKAYPDMTRVSRSHGINRKRRKAITFLCFIEGLFPVLEIESVYSFHGNVEFGWGGTYLTITKLYDQEGKRILRKKDTKEEEVHSESIEGKT